MAWSAVLALGGLLEGMVWAGHCDVRMVMLAIRTLTSKKNCGSVCI